MSIEKISEEIKSIENIENNDDIKTLVNKGELENLAEVIKKIIEKLDDVIQKLND